MDKLDKFINEVSGEDNNKQNQSKPHKFHKNKKFNKNNKPMNKNKNYNNHQDNRNNQDNKDKIRVYPLGGFEEVGKNMTVFETNNDIVIIDMGLQFPEEDMYGIDYVIPDVSSIEKKRNKIRGIVITHGHLDHIGAIPHLLPKLGFPPIFATPLTMGLIQKRLEEFKLVGKAKLNTITPSDKINLGNTFKVEFFRVNHSIPDGVGVILNTSQGNIVYTGDFKFDFTPADDKQCDFGKIAEVGNRGVLALFADSTNATEPGYTVSEKVVGTEIDRVIEKAKGRVIVATFSSLISRVNQVIESSYKNGRKVFLSGRSMENNIEIASNLGYVKVPKGTVRKLGQLRSLPDKKVTIVTTGSQGEELSALTRISLGTHQRIKIKQGDTVIFSSSPIVGNEKAVVTVINNLIRQGANVVTNKHLDVHTSGHAKQEDLKLMLSLTKPKFLVPIHGELRMRAAHKDLAMSIGMAENHISLLDNGDILEFQNGGMRKSKSKVKTDNIMIDGLGMGDTASQVQRERQTMSESGIVMLVFRVYETGSLVADPHVINRGFLYKSEEKQMMNDMIQAAKKAYNDELSHQGKFDDNSRKALREAVARATGKVIRKRLDRTPLILPVMVKV